MSGHDGDVIIPIGADIDDKKVKGAISKFARSLKQAFGAATSDVNSTSKAMDNMSLRIEKAAQKVEKLRKKQEELGKQKVATEDYKNLEKEIEKAQRKLDGLYERSIKFEEMGGKVGSKQWSSLAYDLEKAEDHMNNLLSKQAVMKTMGRAYIPGTETSAYADTTQQLQNARTELDALNRKQSETRSETNKTASNIGAKFRNAFSGLGKMASNAFGKIKNFFSKMKGHAKDSFNGVDKSLHRSLKNILKYAFGIRSLFILFRRLKSAVKDGLGTMAKAFPSMNAQLSNLKNTFNQFKNSLATAFQPLVSAVIPVLVTIINYATQAANAVASFFATLTGQKYILKATKGTESFAAAEDKSTDSTKKNTKAVEDNQKQLGHYDKLNVIDQDKDKDKDASPSSGAGSGAGGLAGSYEKGEIEEAASKFAQMVKKAWKKADFTEVGKYIGQKLKNALDSIPWNGIQEKAKKVGKSLGTLIAGFISVKGLAKSIGQTIGQALNTLMNGLQTFVKNVPWAKFGKFLADGLSSALLAKDKNGRTVIVNIGKTIKDITNAAIDTLSGFAKNVKWKKIGTEISNTLKDTIKGLKAKEFGESVSSLVNGIVTLIYEVVSNKKTWKHLGAKIADGINGFFTKTKWHKLGQAISDTITGLEDAIETALDNIEWEEVGNAIGEFLGNINWWKIFKNALVIVGKAFWGILKALFTPSGDTKTDITKAIIAGLGTIFVLKKFSSLFSTVKALFSGLLEKGAIGAGTSSVVSKLSTSLSGVLGKVGLVAGVAVAGLALGKAIGELIMTGVKEEMEARELANKVAHQIGKNEVALAVAAFLKHSSIDLTLVCSPVMHEKISREGINVAYLKEVFEVGVNSVSSVDDLTEGCDICFLATDMSEATDIIRRMLPHMTEDGVFVSLHGGMISDELIKVAGQEKIIDTMMTWVAERVNDNSVSIRVDGDFYVGRLDGRITEKVKEVSRILDRVLPAAITDNILGYKYSRLVISCSISSTGVLCGLDIGAIAGLPQARKIAIAIARECMKVADAMGIRVENYADKYNYYKLLSGDGYIAAQKRHYTMVIAIRKFKSMMSTSLNLVNRDEPSDVEYYNGYILKKAEEYGIDAPVNRAVTDLIRQIETKGVKIRVENLFMKEFSRL